MMTVERKTEKRGGVSDLLVERAIKWAEVVLHGLTNDAKMTLRPGGFFPSFWLKLSCLSRPFEAVERFKECNKKGKLCLICAWICDIIFQIHFNHTQMTSDIEKLPGAVSDTTVLLFRWDILYRLLGDSAIQPSVMPHCISEKLKNLWVLAGASEWHLSFTGLGHPEGKVIQNQSRHHIKVSTGLRRTLNSMNEQECEMSLG